mmetsp:Transcript_108628/g.346294  ORF Transcript_108628/g.346294 Transcript_108628/m.346294 type:complete len:317 (-) Transcript_108628:24-974(-)
MELLRSGAPLRVPPSPGWEPGELPAAPDLERLACAAACAHRGEVPVVDVSQLRSSDVDLGRPFLLCGAMDPWPCFGWTQQDALFHLGSLSMPWRPCFGDWKHFLESQMSAKAEMTLAAYMGSKEPRPGVLFDQDTPELPVHAAVSRFYEAPPLLRAVHAGRKLVRPIFSVGRLNTGVGFHSHPESWLAQVCGRKLWWIVPKGRPAGDIIAPWQYLLPGMAPTDALFCIASPGQVLYLPLEWAHATWNIDQCCISLGCIGVDEAARTPQAEVLRAVQMQRLAPPVASYAAPLRAPEIPTWPPSAVARSQPLEWVAVD